MAIQQIYFPGGLQPQFRSNYCDNNYVGTSQSRKRTKFHNDRFIQTLQLATSRLNQTV